MSVERIVLIGAGSAMFTRCLVADLLTTRAEYLPPLNLGDAE